MTKRQYKPQAIAVALSLLWAQIIFASPHRQLAPESIAVYTKPYAAVPTGHYSIAALSKKQIRRQTLHWVFVKDLGSGKMGWTPRDELLSPLHFSTKARLLTNSPIFRLQSDRKPEKRMSPQKEITVDLVRIENDWAQVQLHDEMAWVHNSYLIPLEKDAGYFFAKYSAPLKTKPKKKAENLHFIKSGDRLTPLRIGKDWVYVAVGQKKGYLPLHQIVHRIHIADKVKTVDGTYKAHPQWIHKKILAVYVDPLWLGTGVHSITLFAEPSKNSAEVVSVPPWRSLQQHDSLVQNWALSKLENQDTVWWPMHRQSLPVLPWKELAQESFQSIQHNPLFPSLRVGLADALYRSTDGKKWAPLRGVINRDPAFAYSQDGVLFVDDKISTDNGETLTPFIYWEAVLYRLRLENIGVADTIKIVHIQTLQSSQQIVYHIDVGGQRPIKMYTNNRGQTWSVIKETNAKQKSQSITK